MKVEERIKAIEGICCTNCLRKNHTTSECRINIGCKVCKDRHHTLLHVYNVNGSALSENSQNVVAVSRGCQLKDLLEGLPIFGPAGTPAAIPTKLGYILSGKIYAPPLKESIVHSSLNDQLSELWKLEEVPKTNAKIQIPDPCEESFSKSVKRNNEDTEVEAKSIIIEIQNLLKSGGFILRKWSSSHPKVLQDLDTSLLASKPLHSLGDEESVLGLIWNLKTDSIQV
ncbi:uncharacterized protein TNCV_2290841 [Trichonephila clavipes]|uniref:Peptidase aspartic putative domain-containing protein n=1 Tax=Trichonephila clavipes TaxID=2585209 RepID=A0A8X6UX69_TRICX|nr:uncharacterized protein TNCV_2290841 [Trichonephila clavipes]